MDVSVDTLDAPVTSTCSGVVCWLDKHSGTATVLLTALLALLTAIYVILTWNLAKASRTSVGIAQTANDNAIASNTAVLAEAVKSRLDQQLPDWGVTIDLATVEMLYPDGTKVNVDKLAKDASRTGNYRIELRMRIRTPDSSLHPIFGWNGLGSAPLPMAPFNDAPAGQIPLPGFYFWWVYHSVPEDVVEPWFVIPPFALTARSPRGDVIDTYEIAGLRARIDQQATPALPTDIYGPFTATRRYRTLPSA